MTWPMVQIKDVFEVARGGSPRPINDFLTEDENGVNWIMIGDTQDGDKYISSTAKKIKPEGVRKSREVQEGDFLLTNSMSFGRPYILKTSGCIHDGWLVLSPKSEQVLRDYFYYYLGSSEIKSKLAGRAAGAVVKNLNKDIVKELEIPLPPLETQRKIAAILDTADEYRQKTKALIDKYDELAQSLFLEMFKAEKGEREPLSSVCLINPKKSEISGLDKSTLVSFVPMSDVKEDGELCLKETRTLEEVWTGFTYFREGDVVFAKITPCMENGKGCIMRGLTNQIGFGTTEFHVLRPLKGLSNSEFLFYLTHSQAFRKNAEGNMTGSAGQKRVPKEFFSKFLVSVPPYNLQSQFAKRVQAIKSQKAKAHASLEKADELFNSLLQKAFKGEL